MDYELLIMATQNKKSIHVYVSSFSHHLAVTGSLTPDSPTPRPVYTSRQIKVNY